MDQNQNNTDENLDEEANAEVELITPEEMAQLKELYTTFIGNLEGVRSLMDKMHNGLENREENIVLDTWPELQKSLQIINDIALQLNKGDFGPRVQEQLKAMLDKFYDLQERVIAFEPEESRQAKGQKAHEAYTKN